MLELPGRVIVEFLYAGLSVQEICSLQLGKQTSNDQLVLNDRQVSLHSKARLALEHYMILRPLLIGDRLVVGNSRVSVLQPWEVYNLLRRFSHKIGVRVTVRDLRLAQLLETESLIGAASLTEAAA